MRRQQLTPGEIAPSMERMPYAKPIVRATPAVVYSADGSRKLNGVTLLDAAKRGQSRWRSNDKAAACTSASRR